MRTRTLLMMVVIGWFLGAASGLLFMHFAHLPGWHDWHVKRMHERFFKNLKATPEQRAKIETILQESHQKMETIFTQTQPQVEAIRQTTRLQIRELLAPEQQTTFDRLDAKIQAHMKKRFESIRDKWH